MRLFWWLNAVVLLGYCGRLRLCCLVFIDLFLVFRFYSYYFDGLSVLSVWFFGD